MDQFWRDPVFRDRVQDLLIASVETVRSPSARVQIQRQFIVHADSGSIAKLADQNRALRTRLADLDRENIYLAEFRPRPPTSPIDAQLATTQEVLGWNIATLIASINRIGTIRGADLSDVILSRFRVAFDADSQNVSYSRIDRARFNRGVVLQSVDLSGAFLAHLIFDSVTLSGVSLDSANLTGTEFRNTKLINGSSAAEFSTWFIYGAPIERDVRYNVFSKSEAVSWEDCTLDVNRFYPRYDGSLERSKARRISSYIDFARVSWRIRYPPLTSTDRRVNPIPLTGKGTISDEDSTTAY